MSCSSGRVSHTCVPPNSMQQVAISHRRNRLRSSATRTTTTTIPCKCLADFRLRPLVNETLLNFCAAVVVAAGDLRRTGQCCHLLSGQRLLDVEASTKFQSPLLASISAVVVVVVALRFDFLEKLFSLTMLARFRQVNHPLVA